MNRKNSLSFFLLILIYIILSFSFFYCTDSGENSEKPEVFSLSPASKVSSMPSFTLTANGSGFVTGSKIIFNGVTKNTNYTDPGEISCTIDKNEISLNSYSHVVSNNEMSSIPVLVRNPGGEESDTLFFTINDNHSFIIPKKLSEEHSTSFNPAIATDPEGNIFIVYDRYERSVNGYYVSVISSKDKGDSWVEYVDIFTATERCYNTKITSGPDGTIYVTFFNAKLYFSYSNDQGNTWQIPKAITPNANAPLDSDIAIDKNGAINIIWVQRDLYNFKSIYFIRSEDKGVSFSLPVSVAAEWENYSSIYNSALAINNNNGIFVTWTGWPAGGSRYSHVYFNYSHDNGINWNSEDKYFGVCSSSDLSVDPEGNIDLVISSSYLPFQNQIIFLRSVDNGVSWGKGIAVTSNSSDTNPIIRTDSAGNRNIIFKRDKYYYFTRSIPSGVSWTDPIFATDKENIRFSDKSIDMALDNEGNIFIVSEYDNIGLLYFTKSY
ncbi:MAG: sialidase family protein [Acidobacteriota bacterium]